MHPGSLFLFDTINHNLIARLRDILLNGEIFYSLAEAKIVIESWRRQTTARVVSRPSMRYHSHRTIQWGLITHQHHVSGRFRLLQLARDVYADEGSDCLAHSVQVPSPDHRRWHSALLTHPRRHERSMMSMQRLSHVVTGWFEKSNHHFWTKSFFSVKYASRCHAIFNSFPAARLVLCVPVRPWRECAAGCAYAYLDGARSQKHCSHRTGIYSGYAPTEHGQ